MRTIEGATYYTWILDSASPLFGALQEMGKTYAQAVKDHGKLPLRWHLERAAKVAQEGFRIPAAYAGRVVPEPTLAPLATAAFASARSPALHAVTSCSVRAAK